MLIEFNALFWFGFSIGFLSGVASIFLLLHLLRQHG